MPFLRRQSSSENFHDRSERKMGVNYSSVMNVSREDYMLEEEIGRGNFGVVFRATHIPTGMSHAVKIIDTDEADSLDDLLAEITVLHDSQCPQLPHYYGSFIVDSCLWIAMELLGEGSLHSLMEDTGSVLDHRTIAWTMKQVLHALCYLHGEGKLHRDIKAENILLNSVGDVCLADFGVSAKITLSQNKCNTFVGSPYWMAPEVISEAGYNSKADIWSLGITAIELALGRPPLSEIHPMKALLKIPIQPPPTLPEEGPHGSFGKKINSFIECCLKTDPSDRPNAADLLKHPFIKGAQQTDAFQGMLNSRNAAKALQGIFNTDTAPLPSDSTAEVMGGAKSNTIDYSIAGWNFTLDTNKASKPNVQRASVYICDNSESGSDSSITVGVDNN